ncbi:MAG: hypothetical protein ACRYFU_26120 [Janthinobacterium lividum]
MTVEAEFIERTAFYVSLEEFVAVLPEATETEAIEMGNASAKR